MSVSLIDLLDALVVSSGARPRRQGNVVVGVVEEGASTFWCARMDGETRTERVRILPPDWSVVLLVTREAADAIVEGRAEANGGIIEGDVELWESFADTYLRHESPLSLRCRTLTAAGNREKRRTKRMEAR